MYAVAGAAKAIEIEIAERLERRLAEIHANERPAAPLFRESVDAVLVHIPAVAGAVSDVERQPQ